MRENDEEDFRFLAENSADMVCRVGVDLVMRYASPSCERLLGWAPDEMIGKGPEAFVFPEDLPTVAAAHERLMRDGVDPVPTEVRMRRKDGSYAWMEVNARLVRRDGADDASGIVLIMRDVSLRKQGEPGSRPVAPAAGTKDAPVPVSDAERARAWPDDDARFRKAFSMTPVPMIVTTLAGFRIIDVNEAFIAATGRAADELVGRGTAEVGLLEEPACRHVEAALQKADSLRNVEVRLRRRDGASMDCLLSVETASVDARQCVLAVFQDVSGRRRSEAELMEAIESVMKDTSWIGQAVVEKLAQLRRPRRATGSEVELSDLTPREREVLGLMCEGQTDGDIAATLGLSRNTVRNHVTRIYTKIGVHRRAAAIVWAHARGVLAYVRPKRPPGGR